LQCQRFFATAAEYERIAALHRTTRRPRRAARIITA
jgi:hypothetical protein